jgi:hypothetical protein
MIKRTEIDVQRACLIDGRKGEREKLAQSRAIYFIQKRHLKRLQRVVDSYREREREREREK